MSNLAKFIFLSTTKEASEQNAMFDIKTILNHAHVYEEDEHIWVENYFSASNMTTCTVFRNFNIKNLSKWVFPRKEENLDRFPLYIIYVEDNSEVYEGRVQNKWTYFAEILAEKMNASLDFNGVIVPDPSNVKELVNYLRDLISDRKYDIFFYPTKQHQLFQGYAFYGHCFIAPTPAKYSIYELIPFLPLDRSCWMWLGIAFGVSAIIWRVSEGSLWNFLFGMFAQFVGKFTEVKT